MAEHIVSDTYKHLLQPDTLLPSQYFAALKRKSNHVLPQKVGSLTWGKIMSDENRLWAEMDARGQRLLLEIG